MTGLEWLLSITLGVLYIAMLCTVAIVTFRKGYYILGIFGFLLPILWFVGVLLPPAKKSSFDSVHYQQEQAAEANARGGAL